LVIANNVMNFSLKNIVTTTKVSRSRRENLSLARRENLSLARRENLSLAILFSNLFQLLSEYVLIILKKQVKHKYSYA